MIFKYCTVIGRIWPLGMEEVAAFQMRQRFWKERISKYVPLGLGDSVQYILLVLAPKKLVHI